MIRLLLVATALILAVVSPTLAIDPVWTAKQAYDAGDYATAFPILDKAAKAGNADAQTWLGQMYDNGLGVAEDDAEAVRLWRLAAAQDQPFAQFFLAIMLENGFGTAENDAEAAKWYHAAAEGGNYGEAAASLGWMLDNGVGVVEDDAEAAKWYRIAADQGIARAQHNLGILYANGTGVEKNDAEAARLYRLAAEQGDVGAMYHLGFALEKAVGVANNDTESTSWYRKAAETGYAEAQYRLGLMYSWGRGVEKSDADSYTFMLLAAVQNHARAEAGVGYYFENGIVVPKDLAVAEHWYSSSATHGFAMANEHVARVRGLIAGTNNGSVPAVAETAKSTKPDAFASGLTKKLGSEVAVATPEVAIAPITPEVTAPTTEVAATTPTMPEAAPVTPALPGRRVALVVGNGGYDVSELTLANPSNDATAISAKLSEMGFEVITGIDLDYSEMKATIRQFNKAMDGAAVALFYYSGHGIQLGGRNYIIPTDARFEDDTAVDLEVFDTALIYGYMQNDGRLAIALLDACRDNPFSKRSRNGARSLGTDAAEGLAAPQLNGNDGLFIGFATAPGDTAADGVGGINSPFTTAILKHIGTPGLELNQIMNRVKLDVRTATAGDQQPWTNSGLYTDVYLVAAP